MINADDPIPAKLRLHLIQGDDPWPQQWAAGVGGSWAEAATRMAAEGQWERAALAITLGARVDARTVSGSVTPTRTRLPMLELAATDIATSSESLLFIATADDTIAVTHRSSRGEWAGTLQTTAHHVKAWRTQRAANATSGITPGELRLLIDLLGVDVSALEPGRVGVILAGAAVGLPIAHALTACRPTDIEPITHVLGAIGPSTTIKPTGEGMCLIEEPPVAGMPLRFAEVEAETLRRRFKPAAILDNTRAARSWVQRTLHAAVRIPTPDIVHFIGHGSYALTASGQRASAIVLADGELVTASDLLQATSGLRAIVCSACDVAAFDATTARACSGLELG